jgi:GntR family transcriptional regulator, vanillate catabolism transcriptional regulator
MQDYARRAHAPDALVRGLAMAAARATRNSQTTHAVLGLRELILSGEFGPGARMSELPLVDRLGVSRTPVRLALAALEHEGLLRTLPGGGYAIREFTSADVADAIDLRGVLEGTAVRFAIERGASRRDLRALRAVSDRIGEEVHRADYESFERYVGLNTRFHDILVAMARSPQLERALEAVAAVPFASAGAFVLTEAELPESREILVIAHSQHVGLIEAVAGGQATRAEALAREHALLAYRNLQIVLKHRVVPTAIPGHSLVSFAQDGAAQPSAARTAARISRAPGRKASSSGGL